MRLLILLTFLSFPLWSQGQRTADCSPILSKEIDLRPYNQAKLKKLIANLSELKQCGITDEDVVFISNPPVLGSILFELATKKDKDYKLTYQKLYDKIMALRKTENYRSALRLMRLTKEFAIRPADIKNWEQDKILLRKIEPSDDAINKFHDYLKQHSNPKLTYGDVYANFVKIKTREQQTAKDQYKDLFKSAGNVTYQDLLKKAKALGKPLLLYFTGQACINCRKIESAIVEDVNIANKLQSDFYFVNLYVDNKTMLPMSERTISKIDGREIKRVGQKHLELESDKFKNNFQPYFVIINLKGQKIADQRYTNDIQVFEDFLNSTR